MVMGKCSGGGMVWGTKQFKDKLSNGLLPPFLFPPGAER